MLIIKIYFMSVYVRERARKDNRTSIMLDIYHNGKRHFEVLKNLTLVTKPTSPIDRLKNKENRELAESIRNRRAQELEGSEYQIAPKYQNRVDFLEYYQNFIDSYKKKDKRVITSSLTKFKEFLKESKIKGLSINQVNESLVMNFRDFLLEKLNGESPANYLAKFKKVLIQATRDKVIGTNPSANVSIRRGESIKKDILTMEEVQMLSVTPITNEEVKRAFIFSCYTGLRFCDIVSLKWENINFKNKQLSIYQSKTGNKVSINLHASAMSILKNQGSAKESVFKLPSHNACLKGLKHWVKKAEIEKKITWHCARHSFATNIIVWGADVNTASNLLGHASLRYTTRYLHEVKNLQEKAIDNLPSVNL